MNYNHVEIMGNLTKAPELRYTGTGVAVLSMSIAVNRSYKDASGAWVKAVDFFNVTVWKNQAENCQKYLAKGSPVFIVGRLGTEKWIDKDTQKERSKVSITAERVIFLSSGKKDEAQRHPNDNYRQNQAPAQETDEDGFILDQPGQGDEYGEDI